MKTFDNFGRPGTETNTLVKRDGTVVNVHTVSYNGTPAWQTISTRTPDGQVKTEIVRGGKLLP